MLASVDDGELDSQTLMSEGLILWALPALRDINSPRLKARRIVAVLTFAYSAASTIVIKLDWAGPEVGGGCTKAKRTSSRIVCRMTSSSARTATVTNWGTVLGGVITAIILGETQLANSASR
jgi:hypothetical protein